MAWTTRELEILATTSRVSSVFSLCGALFVIITFCSSRSFHRPINRLAFFAAFGNIMTNIATMTSRDGIQAGLDSDLCRVQAVFIQWFLPADALFCLAMALNVYLTVFKKYTTARLKKLEVYYILLCYGVPMVPALVFLFVKDSAGIPMYGDATLWCWISTKWNFVRIAAFYGPVWVVVVATCVIYVLAGRVIFNLRQNLRIFAKDPPQSQQSQTYNFGPGNQPPALDKPAGYELGSVGKGKLPAVPATAKSVPRHVSYPDVSALQSYTCTIESGYTAKDAFSSTEKAEAGRKKALRNAAVEANTAAWAYCRCAMLFFLALVITWLPSSINRVYTLRYPDATPFSLNFAAALVLPCQGFWNALIYVITTLPACRKFIGIIWEYCCMPYRYMRRIATTPRHTRSSGASDLANLVD